MEILLKGCCYLLGSFIKSLTLIRLFSNCSTLLNILLGQSLKFKFNNGFFFFSIFINGCGSPKTFLWVSTDIFSTLIIHLQNITHVYTMLMETLWTFNHLYRLPRTVICAIFSIQKCVLVNTHDRSVLDFLFHY